MLGQIVGMVLACILVSKQADGSRKANASLLVNVLVDTQWRMGGQTWVRRFYPVLQAFCGRGAVTSLPKKDITIESNFSWGCFKFELIGRELWMI
jgi:hypothetical protein